MENTNDTNSSISHNLNQNLEQSKASNVYQDENNLHNKSHENLTQEELENLLKKMKKSKKEKEFKINSGNIAIISSSLGLLLCTITKLLRILLALTGGIIIFLYIISAILIFFALFASVKNSMKNELITVDSFFTGVALIVLILI